MIVTINSGSKFISVYSNPKTYVAPGGTHAGTVRYDTAMQQLVVYTGSSWIPIDSTANIAMSPTAEDAIDWAIKKLKEERELDALMKEHPGLKDAKERFDIMLALVKKHEL